MKDGQGNYDGRKVDVYAIGICLLNIAFDIKIISRASSNDPLYRYIIKKDFRMFWLEVEYLLKAHKVSI
jgi:hypothetical protein